MECVRCRQKLPLLAFDAERMSHWRSSGHVHRDAKCKACGPEPSEEIAAVECVGCRQKLPCQAFDAERFNMLRKNKVITKQAKCNACWAKLPDRRSNAQKQTWKQILYKCSDCNSELLANKFDTTKLKQWEDSATLYLAQCGNCDRDMKNIAQAMKCNLCGATKPSHAFSPARQRARDYSTRRCRDCDFPACSSCGTIPTQPKQKPYMCPVCLFPPCSCGAPIPPWTQNRVTVKPTWQCEACRK